MLDSHLNRDWFVTVVNANGSATLWGPFNNSTDAQEVVDRESAAGSAELHSIQRPMQLGAANKLCLNCEVTCDNPNCSHHFETGIPVA